MIDGLVRFVKNNPLFCVLVITLALTAPSLLKGLAAFVLYSLLGILLLGILLVLVMRWRFNRVHSRMTEQFRRAAEQQQNTHTYTRNRPTNEGEVRLHRTSETPEKRIADDVGDYVDFEETKNR